MCNKCGIESTIVRSYNKVEGDNSPDTPTKLYTVLVMACINPDCSEQGKEYEIMHEQHIGSDYVE